MWYTHINRGTIDKNRKHDALEAPIKIQEGKYGKPLYCSEVALPNGSRLVYDPTGSKILPCGARLVIVSDEQPKVIR